MKAKTKAWMTRSMAAAICWLMTAGLTAQPAPPPDAPPPPDAAEREDADPGREGRHWRLPGERWGRGAEIKELMDKLRQDDPAEHARLEALSKTDRMAYYKEIWQKLPPQGPMRNSKLWSLELRCRELGKQYREANTDVNKARLKGELELAVKESFDTMLADSKKRLEDLQERLQNMEAKQDEILAQRLESFLTGSGHMPPPPEKDGEVLLPPPPEKDGEVLLPPPPPPGE